MATMSEAIPPAYPDLANVDNMFIPSGPRDRAAFPTLAFLRATRLRCA